MKYPEMRQAVRLKEVYSWLVNKMAKKYSQNDSDISKTKKKLMSEINGYTRRHQNK